MSEPEKTPIESQYPVRTLARKAPEPTTHHACCVAQPGDTLVIGLATPTPAGTVERISESFRRNLPDTIKICVIDNVSAFQVIRSEGGTPAMHFSGPVVSEQAAEDMVLKAFDGLKKKGRL